MVSGDNQTILEKEILKAREHGVLYHISVATSLENSLKISKTLEGLESVSASAGIHPNEIPAGLPNKHENTLLALQTLVENGKTIAVGECGIDIAPCTQQNDVEHQIPWFEQHIELSSKFKKPLLIHCRNGFKECFSSLKKHKNELYKPLFHCFTGGVEEARIALDLGCYLSFSGILTFKNANTVREAAAFAPLDRIVVETDAPYLAPAPHRGEQNSLEMIRYTIEKIVGIRSENTVEIYQTIFKNSADLFNLGYLFN